MTSAKLTSKGRTTIPPSVRDEMKLNAGDSIEFVKIAEGQYAIVRKISAMELQGRFHRPSRKAVTIEQMNEAVIVAVVKNYRK